MSSARLFTQLGRARFTRTGLRERGRTAVEREIYRWLEDTGFSASEACVHGCTTGPVGVYAERGSARGYYTFWLRHTADVPATPEAPLPAGSVLHMPFVDGRVYTGQLRATVDAGDTAPVGSAVTQIRLPVDTVLTEVGAWRQVARVVSVDQQTGEARLTCTSGESPLGRR